VIIVRITESELEKKRRFKW